MSASIHEICPVSNAPWWSYSQHVELIKLILFFCDVMNPALTHFLQMKVKQ